MFQTASSVQNMLKLEATTAISPSSGSDAVPRIPPHIKVISKKRGHMHNMANKLLVIHRTSAETLVGLHQAPASPVASHSSPEATLPGAAGTHSDDISSESASDIESEPSSPTRTSRSLVAYRRNVVYEGMHA